MRFLFFDRILEIESGKHIRATKCVGLEDECFDLHFDSRPVMPATLVIECLAQTAGWLNFISHDRRVRMVVALVEDVSFYHQVLPGDVLELEARIQFLHRGGATISGEARVDGQVVARVERMVFANQTFEPEDLQPAEAAHYEYLRAATQPEPQRRALSGTRGKGP